MPIETKKRAGESASALIYRFLKKVQRSGVVRETRKRRFKQRPTTRRQRRESALHRDRQRQVYEKAKKLGGRAPDTV